MNMQKLNQSGKYHCGTENLSPLAAERVKAEASEGGQPLLLTFRRRCRSHHFNCRFEDQRESEMPPEHKSKELDLCTGRERLTKYEQEGLVPFVGKLSKKKPTSN